jgi:hypothetical protein
MQRIRGFGLRAKAPARASLWAQHATVPMHVRAPARRMLLTKACPTKMKPPLPLAMPSRAVLGFFPLLTVGGTITSCYAHAPTFVLELDQESNDGKTDEATETAKEEEEKDTEANSLALSQKKEKNSTALSRTSLLSLLSAMSQDTLLYVLAVASSMLVGLCKVTTSNVIGAAFDAIASGTPITPSLLKLVALYLGMGVLTFVSLSTQSIAIDNLSLRLKVALFEAALMKDISYFERNHGDGEGDDSSSASAALGMRMDQDVQQATRAIRHLLSSGVQSIVTIVGGCMSMAMSSGQVNLTTVHCRRGAHTHSFYSPPFLQLSSFMMLSTPLASVLFTTFAGYIKIISRTIRGRIDSATSTLACAIHSIETVDRPPCALY